MNRPLLFALCMGFVAWGFSPNAAWSQNKELRGCAAPEVYSKNRNLSFGLTYSQVPGRLAITRHDIKVEGNTYKMSAVSEAKGLLALVHAGQLNQSSEGLLIEGKGYAPQQYNEKRGKKPPREVVVEAVTKQVQFKRNGESAPYVQGLQDRLSLAYQLAAIWACNGIESTGVSAKVPVMSTGKIDFEVFSAEAVEEVMIEQAGKDKAVRAIRLTNKPKDKEDDFIRIWLAPSMGWTPIQIQVEDHKNTKMTQTLIATE